MGFVEARAIAPPFSKLALCEEGFDFRLDRRYARQDHSAELHLVHIDSVVLRFHGY